MSKIINISINACRYPWNEALRFLHAAEHDTWDWQVQSCPFEGKVLFWRGHNQCRDTKGTLAENSKWGNWQHHLYTYVNNALNIYAYIC